MLDQVFKGVLNLADEFQTNASPEMIERQELVESGAEFLRSWVPDLELLVSSEGGKLSTKSGGRQSHFAPVPWIRIFNPDYSPSASAGFYLVYLFAADGSSVYLSLNQGTSEFRANKMRPVTTPGELDNRAAIARSKLDDWDSGILTEGEFQIDLGVEKIEVGAESKLRARNYEHANIVAIKYAASNIPQDEVLLKDLKSMAPLLGALQGQSVPTTSTKHDGPATKPAVPKVQGRMMDSKAKIAVELRAMKLAEDHYSSLGWNVEDTSKYQSFDLKLTRSADEYMHVEVKGTTGAGIGVNLTHGEVKNVLSGAPTSLFVVRNIKVTYNADGSRDASGGDIQIIEPWVLEESRLVPTEYRYSVSDHP